MSEDFAKIQTIIDRKLNEPQRSGGAWIVWDQFASRGLMNDYVAKLKAAGIPAFFSASERRFGVKKEG